MRTTWRRTAAVLTATVAMSGVIAASPHLATADAARYRAPLVKAIKALPTRAEKPRGYDRDEFEHWVDADSDGQDTRAEVLIAESRARVTLNGGTVVTGRWRSYYDNKTWTRASDVDIDHLVPLKESWDSGARRWNDDTRRAFANDLTDSRSLVAVTDNVNQSKADRDPAQWLLRKRAQCRYIKEWVAVKHRWRLSVDAREKKQLLRVAKQRKCRGAIAVTRATISTTPNPGGGSGSCDAAYPTVCIPPPPPDLDCGDITHRNFTVKAPDPHRFDNDGDGVGCET